MLTLLTPKQFAQQRRDARLEYAIYAASFAEIVEGFDLVAQSLATPSPDADPADFMVATRQRAWDGINHLTSCYSAGHGLEDLRSLYPAVLAYWEEYARFDIAYDAASDVRDARVAQLPLCGDGFDQANRLLCFAILLGQHSLIPRLLPLIDHNNPRRDGMFERLLCNFVSGRGLPPDECTRKLPYSRTLPVFKADASERPALMAKYLDGWYQASRGEPYYETHGRDELYLGYWSWEAAALTFLLDIDDAGYRTAPFYPKDLVVFARSALPMAS